MAILSGSIGMEDTVTDSAKAKEISKDGGRGQRANPSSRVDHNFCITSIAQRILGYDKQVFFPELCGLRSKDKAMKFDETETRKASLGFDT